METAVDDLANDLFERVEISPKPDRSPGADPSSKGATTSVGPSEEYLTFGVQLPKGEGELDLPSVIRDIAIRVDQKESTQPAVAPRALVNFFLWQFNFCFDLTPPNSGQRSSSWDPRESTSKMARGTSNQNTRPSKRRERRESCMLPPLKQPLDFSR